MKKFINTTTKALIWWLIISGSIWISLSYVLAFMGKEQIAEALSQNVCEVVLGGLITYVITAAISNVFKKNNGGIFGTTIEGGEEE